MKYTRLTEDALPKYLYKIVPVKTLVKILNNNGLAVSKEMYNSLTKDWSAIYYNEDFEMVYGYTPKTMCILKLKTIELLKNNKLIEVQYTESWMNAHPQIRNYIMGYIKDFDKENWVNDLSGLGEDEQEVIAPKKLVLSTTSVDLIYVPSNKVNQFKKEYTTGWSFVGSTSKIGKPSAPEVTDKPSKEKIGSKEIGYYTFQSSGIGRSTYVIKGSFEYMDDRDNSVLVKVQYGIYDYDPQPKSYYPSNRFIKNEEYTFVTYGDNHTKIKNIRKSTPIEIDWLEKIKKEN